MVQSVISQFNAETPSKARNMQERYSSRARKIRDSFLESGWSRWRGSEIGVFMARITIWASLYVTEKAVLFLESP